MIICLIYFNTNIASIILIIFRILKILKINNNIQYLSKKENNTMKNSAAQSAVTQNINMLNKLHMAMIELYKGDSRRIQHFCKVHSYARLIAQMENVDYKTLFIIETAALTHDIGIHTCEEKYGECGGRLQEKEGPALAKELLERLGFETDISERVQYLIAHHHTYSNIDGIDYQILVEADFLVNMYEDGVSKGAVLKAYNNIFKTKYGKYICKDMFLID